MENNKQELEFELLPEKNGAVLKKGDTCEDKVLIIPSHVEIEGKDYPVIEIGEFACASFFDSNKAKKVVIPNTVKRIKRNAFCHCKELTTVVLPDSVEEIEDRAFFCCKKLRSFEVPKSVKTIGTLAMVDWNTAKLIVSEDNPWFVSVNNVIYTKDMTELVQAAPKSELNHYAIPNSVKKIRDGAFFACEKLTGIVFPESLTYIGGSSFHHCKNLREINIPSSVLFIDYWAFMDTGIGSITISENNPCFCSKDNIVYNKQQTALLFAANKYNFGSIVIQESVIKIAAAAFESCKYLKEITIPDSVTSIGSYAFANCINLKNVALPRSLEVIEESLFNGDKKLTSIQMPEALTIIQGYAFNKCEKLSKLFLPETVAKLGDYAFSDCKNLKELTLPNSLVKIGDYAFENCAFVKMKIPESVTSLGDDAFAFNQNLEEVSIPEKIKEIGFDIFWGCKKLKIINGADARIWLYDQEQQI